MSLCDSEEPSRPWYAEVLDRRLALLHGDGERVSAVGDHFIRVEVDAPGGEEVLYVRGAVGRRRLHGVARRLIRVRHRIDESENVSAAQRVLIDRELRGGREVLRIDEHEHAHVGADGGRVRLQRAYVEELLRLRVDHPGLRRLSALRIEAARHGQGGEPGDHRLRRMRELIDELRDVVLEEALLVRVEEGDRLLAVGGIGAGEPEVELGADLIHVLCR